MERRWHETSKPSTLLLLIPLLLVLAAVVWVVSTTPSRKLTNTVTGRSGHWMDLLARPLAALALGVAIVIVVAAVHRWWVRRPAANRRRFMTARGWQPRPKNNPNSPKGVTDRLHFILPTTPRPTVAAASVELGTDASGRPFLLTCDESMLVVGPPGSGKDRRLAIPLLDSWPGPALATSTKVDLATATLSARSRRGPVAVFDPAGFGLAGSDAIRWNPVIGCRDRDVAARRAAAIIAGGTPSMSEQFWSVAATRVLRGCLLAAAYSTESVLDAGRWSTSAGGWIAAAEILSAHGEDEWAAQLTTDANLDPRTSSSIVATLTTTMIGLSNARLRDAMAPSGQQTDPATILAAGGTIYAVAPAEPDSHLVFRPWTTLLASEVAAVLREQARGARLEPPALLLLNELVHVCPLPELPGLLADGRGQNIATVAIVQDPAQLAARYSPDDARAITGAAQHRLLLSTNGEETAREWSDLIGTYHVATKSTTHKTMHLAAESASTSHDQRPILPPHELRYLPYGCAVMLPRGFPPLPLHLRGT